jgi:hypothetical protein
VAIITTITITKAVFTEFGGWLPQQALSRPPPCLLPGPAAGLESRDDRSGTRRLLQSNPDAQVHVSGQKRSASSNPRGMWARKGELEARKGEPGYRWESWDAGFRYRRDARNIGSRHE